MKRYDEPAPEARAGREPEQGDSTTEQAPAAPRRDDPVDEASQESFPASDPPAWTHLHLGGPDDHP